MNRSHVLFELAWILPSIAIPTGMLVALLVTAFGMGIHVPGHAGRVDPRTLEQTPPFNAPGVTQVAPGRYQAVILVKACSFTPNEIRVPVGSELTFIASSQDVIHGFRMHGTNVNMMIIPGQISRATARFTRPGEYLFVCHEYCGTGHHLMSGKVIVQG